MKIVVVYFVDGDFKKFIRCNNIRVDDRILTFEDETHVYNIPLSSIKYWEVER